MRVAFIARPEFTNASGTVQGGFLAAMLDDCMGPAILIATDAELYPVTISLNVTFLAPVGPGPIFGEAKVRQLGKSIAYVEASLSDGDGADIARATSSVRVLPMSKALANVRAPGRRDR
ncbi:MAG: phenylacetic acid degradation-related protein [Phenylobacterium sp.]|nr:phenylacetic acid degradation-related protein [Phenylobacterium sp.]